MQGSWNMENDLSCASAKEEAGESYQWPTSDCASSCLMKVFERAVLVHIQEQVADYIDPCQFAYRRNRGVEHAIWHVLSTIDSHPEKPWTYIRLMLYDFSSAFNTIQPHLLGRELLKMNVDAYTILWILDYITNRPQYFSSPDVILCGWLGSKHQFN